MRHARKTLAAVALFGLAPLVGCDQGVEDAGTPGADAPRQQPPADQPPAQQEPDGMGDPGGIEDPTTGG